MTQLKRTFKIVDDTGREWADAETRDAAILGAELISHEEDREMTVVSPTGDEIAWTFPDQPTFTLQGMRRA